MSRDNRVVKHFDLAKGDISFDLEFDSDFILLVCDSGNGKSFLAECLSDWSDVENPRVIVYNYNG